MSFRIHSPLAAPLRPRLLALALHAALVAVPLAGVSMPTSAQAQAATFTFDLPAAPLSTTLTRIAAQTNARLTADAALTRGKSADAINGTMTLSQALERALAGSGLRHRVTADGTITLDPAPRAATQLSPVVVSGTSVNENAWGPVQGYVAKRSASSTKTDTPLIETPQSVSVVTGDELRDRQAETLSQALNYTPGFTSPPTSFNRTADRFRIRGLDVESGTAGSLRDGLRLQINSYDGIQEPYGVERVEVVRGAASVLYGQLSPGGMVNTVSKRPTDVPQRELGIQLGDHDRKQLMGDFSGPIADTDLSYRLTMLVRDSGTPQDKVNDDRVYIAPALTWKPNTDTSLTLLSYYQKSSTRFPAPLPYQLTKGVGDGPFFIDRDKFIGEPDYDRMDSESFALGYEFEHAFNDDVKVRHKLRAYESDLTFRYMQIVPGGADTAAGTGLLARRYSDRRDRARAVTADVNVESKWNLLGMEHTLLVGVDAYRTVYDSDNFRANVNPPFDLSTYAYGTPVVVDRSPAANRGSKITTAQKGVYIQDQINLGDHWTVLLGGRHDWVTQDQTVHRTGGKSDQDNSATTWRAGLVYKAANGLAPYASYSESFFPVSAAEAGGQQFSPTRGKQHEIGVRYQPEGRNLLLSAALFNLVQSDVLKFVGTDPRQVGEIRSRGLELEARAELTRQLSMVASYSYIDARITRSTDAAEVGQRSDETPYHQAALWLDYNFAKFGLPQLEAGLGARYRGTSRAAGVPKGLPAYTLFDAMAQYQFDANWELALNVSNLANKDYVFCEAGTCRYGDERRMTATLSYHW